jgi:hypothetical protein
MVGVGEDDLVTTVLLCAFGIPTWTYNANLVALEWPLIFFMDENVDWYNR